MSGCAPVNFEQSNANSEPKAVATPLPGNLIGVTLLSNKSMSSNKVVTLDKTSSLVLGRDLIDESEQKVILFQDQNLNYIIMDTLGKSFLGSKDQAANKSSAKESFNFKLQEDNSYEVINQYGGCLTLNASTGDLTYETCSGSEFQKWETSLTLPAKDPVTPKWVTCAKERRTCNFAGRKTVRYGVEGRFVYKVMNGPVSCVNEIFTDPAYGTFKKCEVDINSGTGLMSLPQEIDPNHASLIDITKVSDQVGFGFEAAKGTMKTQGSYLEYSINVSVTDVYYIALRSSNLEDSEVEVTLNNTSQGAISIPKTTDEETYETSPKVKLFLEKGSHVVRIKLNQDGKLNLSGIGFKPRY